MLEIVPINLEQANLFVNNFHRHHKSVPGSKFSLAVCDKEQKIRGVAIVGRPVARFLDDGWTLEVNRCCTDGTRNACSMLYGASWKAAKALGFKKIVTYTLPEEGGASLRASGWNPIFDVGGTTWNNNQRFRIDNPNTVNKKKIRWEASLPISSAHPPQVELMDDAMQLKIGLE